MFFWPQSNRWLGMTEPDTKDLDALLGSLNSSAERFQTLWFSFLGLTLYFAITALATTHRNLLLGEPQTLPILNIKVELLPFYLIAPLFYLVFHFYVLMMLVLLGRTAEPFERQLRTTLPDEVGQELYRARVENALFLQILVGMKRERTGFDGTLLTLIALITIVFAPIATLILMQMMFLPYHSFAITWWHRALVFADLVLIIVMTRRFFSPSDITAPVSGQANRIADLCLIAIVLWLSLWEGRWAGEPFIGRSDFAATKNGLVWGLFQDRLNLRGELIVGKDRLEEIGKEIASRGGTDFVPTRIFRDRDLQAADFSAADLRGVTFAGAIMRGAGLQSARLDHADLSVAQLQGANLSGARMRGANLGGTQMQGCYIVVAQLQVDHRKTQIRVFRRQRLERRVPLFGRHIGQRAGDDLRRLGRLTLARHRREAMPNPVSRVRPSAQFAFRDEVGQQPTVRAQRLQKSLAPARQIGVALAEQIAHQALKGLHERRMGNVALVLVELAPRHRSVRRRAAGLWRRYVRGFWSRSQTGRMNRSINLARWPRSLRSSRIASAS